MRRLYPFVLLLVLLCFSTVLAQDNTCSALVQETITAVQDVCAATGRNQACYGNVALAATPREDVQNFTFQQQGDLVNVADIDTLRLRSLNPEENEWGVALMKLQADLPDTLPGQNVTFLLFGDVEIQNAVEPTPELTTLEVVSGGGINVRSGPSTDYAVIGSLAKDETVTANGRNEDASWLRIQLPDSRAFGWVRQDLVTVSSDTNQLAAVAPQDTVVPFKPMQAFYFRTGIGGAECAEAPGDGILIQTPAGAGKINLRANDVDIQLGSTAYLQAQPSKTMTVSVVEGQAKVTAAGATVTVPAGAQVEIPIDENLKASAEPGNPEPYDLETLQPLPVTLLPETFTLAAPVSEQAVQAANQAAGQTGSLAGNSLPGFDNLGMMFGMNAAAFCPMLDQALADAGMTRQQYLEMLRQVMGQMPADAQAGFQQLEQLINQCS